MSSIGQRDIEPRRLVRAGIGHQSLHRSCRGTRPLLPTAPMVVAPFLLNALHAKIGEAVGFPDVGLLTMSTMVTNARDMADTVPIKTIPGVSAGVPPLPSVT